MPRHADQTPASRDVGNAIKTGNVTGVITDAMVAASATVAALITAVRAVTGLHADRTPIIERVVSAIKVGENIGDFTDANINASTTVAAVLALTAWDSTIANAILSFHE